MNLTFTEPALGAALRTYLAALDARDAELAVLESQLRSCWASVDPLAAMVRRLAWYRGIAELTGLTLAAEVADFRRFPSAPAFMGFTGLTPSEYSSGARTRRGAITKAGPQLIRSTLIETAWAYRHRPAIGATLRRRQAGCAEETLARSWKAQQRLQVALRDRLPVSLHPRCGAVRRFLAALLAVTVVSTAGFACYAAVGIDYLQEYYIGYFYFSAPVVTLLVIAVAVVHAPPAPLGAVLAAGAAVLGVAAFALAPATAVNTSETDPALPGAVRAAAARPTARRS